MRKRRHTGKRKGQKVTPDKAVDAMSKYGGTVLKTSLSKQDEQELQDALHGGGEAAAQ
jgi:uncharacterized membrane protein